MRSVLLGHPTRDRIAKSNWILEFNWMLGVGFWNLALLAPRPPVKALFGLPSDFATRYSDFPDHSSISSSPPVGPGRCWKALVASGNRAPNSPSAPSSPDAPRIGPVPTDRCPPAPRNSRTPITSVVTVDHETIFLVDSNRWEEPKPQRLARFAP